MYQALSRFTSSTLRRFTRLFILVTVFISSIEAVRSQTAVAQTNEESKTYVCQELEDGLLAGTGQFTTLPDGKIRDDLTGEVVDWQFDLGQPRKGTGNFSDFFLTSYDLAADAFVLTLKSGRIDPHAPVNRLHCYLFSKNTQSVEKNSQPAHPPAWEGIPLSETPIERIAFASYRNGNYDIYLINPDGSGETRLTTNSADDSDPTWSPDGAAIIFSSKRDGNEEIYRINADGSGEARLTWNTVDDFSPAWSPNGEWVAFSSLRDASLQVYIMKPDGLSQTRLTYLASVGGVATWSPNSQTIAFQSSHEGNSEIYTMNVYGGGLTRLTNHPANDWGPSWSPDGTKIAFTSDRGGNFDIFTMNPNGTEVQQLTTGPYSDWIPSWSTDGSKLVYVSDHYGDFDVFMMNPDGSQATIITLTTAQDVVPEWTTQKVLLQRVLHIIYDPYLPNRDRYLTSYYLDPVKIAQEISATFKEYTHNRVQFIIQDQITINGFNRRLGGYIHTEETYFSCWDRGWPQSDPQCNGIMNFDYDWLINDPSLDICGRLNRGEIDEVWIDPPPFSGAFESVLTGPNGFWYNGPTYSSNNCGKLLPIMGFNYERQWTGGHTFGHRMEATMEYAVYGSWNGNDPEPHNWEKFGMVRFQSPSFNYAGCGSIHYSPNAIAPENDYDMDITDPFDSICDDFYNYPNLGNPQSVKTSVNCTNWNCNEIGYNKWWYTHLPHFPGVGSDGKLNDWWFYFLDPNIAKFGPFTLYMPLVIQ